MAPKRARRQFAVEFKAEVAVAALAVGRFGRPLPLNGGPH